MFPRLEDTAGAEMDATGRGARLHDESSGFYLAGYRPAFPACLDLGNR